VRVEWDSENPEPRWESALVLRDVEGLELSFFKGEAARSGVEAVVRQNAK
jgi:hypothetical protein